MKRLSFWLLALSLVLLAAPAEAQTKPTPDERDQLVQWIVSSMTKHAPPGKSKFEGAKETEEEGRARYEAIVRDLLEVTYDPAEPVLAPYASDEDGRLKTALTVLSVVRFESGYRRDVDLGVGPNARGDNGSSWCLVQLNIGNGKTAEGWTGKELVKDRKKCLRAGLHAIQKSFALCEKLDVRDRLSVFTTGKCRNKQKESRNRVVWSQKWFVKIGDAAKEQSRDWKDATIQALLYPSTKPKTTTVASS
jgi:hypothetical protein